MIIYNARVITWEDENRVLDNHAVLIRGKLIKDLGPSAEILQKYPEEEKIDAGGKILMPGQICSHTHFYGAYSTIRSYCLKNQIIHSHDKLLVVRKIYEKCIQLNVLTNKLCISHLI